MQQPPPAICTDPVNVDAGLADGVGDGVSDGEAGVGVPVGVELAGIPAGDDGEIIASGVAGAGPQLARKRSSQPALRSCRIKELGFMSRFFL